jgi:hypothetical protein
MNALEQRAEQDDAGRSHMKVIGRAKVINATVTYDSMTSDWIIAPSPIKLEHDGDKVRWDLANVYAHTPWKDKIARVEIVFKGGPPVLDTKLGPHTKIDLNLVDLKHPTLLAYARNKKYGLYCYDLVVHFKDPRMEPIRLNPFPIDPQIDNVAPPPPPHGFYPEDSEG